MFLNASTNISGLLIPSQKKESSLLYHPVAAIGPLLLPNIIEEVDKLQKNTQNSEPSEEETSSE
jgi:membrane protein required for colicin V production